MLYVADDAKAELARRAKQALEKLRTTPSFKAGAIRALRSELFPLQLAVLDDPSPRLAVCCSRRAGKSEMAARMIAIELIRARHNEYVLFAARTLMRARQIIWGLLEKINDDYGLGWTMSAHIGQIKTPDGAVFTLLGVDDQNAAEKVRGSKYRLAVLDEAATYETLLERLVVDCLEPGTIDLSPRGRIVLTGTPGYSKQGYWFEACAGLKPGWKGYHWTLHQNPHVEDAEAKLESIRIANGWDHDDPTFRREYKGEWVSDDAVLVYAAREGRNTIEDGAFRALFSPPHGMSFLEWVREEWTVTVGADIGYTDAFAVAVLGSPPHSQDVYVMETEVEEGLLAGQQADKIAEKRTKYGASRTVIDVGGAGKLVFEEFRARYGKATGGPAHPAQKQGRVEAIGLFNSDLRAGRVKAVLSQAAAVFKEWCSLPWADEDKTKAHPAWPNHASDAVLYAWRAHRAYLAKPAPRPKTEADAEAERFERRRQKAIRGR